MKIALLTINEQKNEEKKKTEKEITDNDDVEKLKRI